MKLNKEELVQIIEETVLEMLKEGDERLITLMMQHDENMNEGVAPDKKTFVNETIEMLTEKLGLLTEAEEEDAELLTEQHKMLKLVEWLEEGEK